MPVLPAARRPIAVCRWKTLSACNVHHSFTKLLWHGG